MPQEPEIPPIAVLFIDASKNQRAYWPDQLKSCSADYEILEASDGESGLALCRFRRIDCVVLELSPPEAGGFEVLVKLIPIPNRPVGVVVLTLMTRAGIWELAKQNGAHMCLGKFTSVDDLDRAIRRAVAFAEQMPKEDRYWPQGARVFGNGDSDGYPGPGLRAHQPEV